MKRFSALILAVLLMLTAAACGEKTAPGETAEPFASVPETVTTEPPTEAPIPEKQISQPEPTQPELSGQPEPEDGDFVPVESYIPGILVELKYATADNFTGQIVYFFDQCYLRYGTVKKLLEVQNRLAEQGLGLKIWDGFRPVSAQFALWEICPDPVYVANPETGFSSHSRGNTVDLTLVDSRGMELPMPTGFDDFSALADRDYADCPEEAARNAALLQQVMEQAGFTGYYNEWWHFTDATQYPVEKVFTPVVPEERFALCEEFITLRTAPDASSEEICKIPAGYVFTVLANHEGYSYVNYRGMFGYVLSAYTSLLGE